MAKTRVRPVLTHEEAQLIIDALEDYAENFRKLAEAVGTSEIDERRYIGKAEECEELASFVNNERIAAGGIA